MLKTVLIILSATSLSWASNYSHYNSYYGHKQDYKAYDPQKAAAELLQKKLKIMEDLKQAAARNHHLCQNRKECLNLDQQSLDQTLEKYYYTSEGQDLFAHLKTQMGQTAESDIATTEWDVYNSLSATGQQQYKTGVRINSPAQAIDQLKAANSSSKSVSTQKEIKFNIDDLKIYLLQEIEKNHQQCDRRSNCLQSDIQLVQQMKQYCPAHDSTREVFEQIADSMQDRAQKQPFDTLHFYQLYQDYLSKRYPLLYKSQDRQQWNDMIKTIHPSKRRDPAILNHNEIKEESKPENQAKKQLQKEGEKLATGLLDQVFGGSGKGQGSDLLGNLFGG